MKSIVRLFILLVLSNISFGQASRLTLNALTEDLNQIQSQGYINGFSVAIVNQDSILYARGFGYSNTVEKIKYTELTIQNIASISKTFIGVALLKAQELGSLRLDEPINKYLPFKVVNPYFVNTSITIRQLATHTSSIKDPSRYEKNGYILKEEINIGTKVNRNFRPSSEMIDQDVFLRNILSEKGKWYKKSTFLKSMPGELFEYSNIAAGLAALVIESATGQSFNEFVKSYIFDPSKMYDSGWFYDEVQFSMHSKLYADKETELAPYQLVNYADGGLITSSDDLGKYLTELIAGYAGNGRILTNQSFEELFTPQLSDDHYKERNEGVYNDEYNMSIFMGMSAQG